MSPTPSERMSQAFHVAAMTDPPSGGCHLCQAVQAMGNAGWMLTSAITVEDRVAQHAVMHGLLSGIRGLGHEHTIEGER